MYILYKYELPGTMNSREDVFEQIRCDDAFDSNLEHSDKYVTLTPAHVATSPHGLLGPN